MNEPVAGHVEAEVARELPGLGISSIIVSVGDPKTPNGLERELAAAADRINGANAARAATGTVASAVRGLVRQLGMDPERIPGTVDAVVRRRLLEGGFRPSGLVPDALALAVLELGVPLFAFDDAQLEGDIRITRAEGDGELHVEGDLVVADSARVVSRLFADPLPGLAPGRGTASVRVVAVLVPGMVPGFAELALTRAAELLGGSEVD